MATLDADDLAAIRAIVADELTGPIAANVTQINGSSASLLSVPVDANVTQVNGSAATLLSEPIDANVVSGGSAVIVPATGSVPARVSSTNITVFTSETVTVSITVTDASGNPVNMNGKTLGVFFDTLHGSEVANIDNSDITRSGDSNHVISFAMPSAVTIQERTLKFAVRDASAPKTVYVSGIANIVSAPE